MCKRNNYNQTTVQYYSAFRACRSGVDRYVRNVKAAGSNPAKSIPFFMQPGEEEATGCRRGCEGGAFGSERKGRGFEFPQVHSPGNLFYSNQLFLGL
jgi:hypothetical protein